MSLLYVPEPTVRVQIDIRCDKPTLRDSIKTTVPDYNEDDPKTWPLAFSNHHEGRWPTLASFEKLPTGVAFTQAQMDMILKLSPTAIPAPFENVKNAFLKFVTWNARFIAHPFNFARDGTRRSRVGIPGADYNTWMWFRELNNTHTVNIATKRLNFTTPSQPVLPTPEAPNSQSIGPATMNRSPISAAEAYEKLRKSFAESPRATTEIAELENKLKAAEDRHKQEKEALAQRLEDKHQAWQTTSTVKHAELSRKHDALEKVSKADKEKIASLEKEAEERKTEVERFRSDLKKAEDQIVTVWAWRDAEVTSAVVGKRKAENDGTGPSGKQARMES